MVKYRRAILLAKINSLPVNLRRVVALPEVVKQGVIAYQGRIKGDLNRFSVPGITVTDFTIRRILYPSTAVPNSCCNNTGQIQEDIFNPPETPCRKRSNLNHCSPPKQKRAPKGPS